MHTTVQPRNFVATKLLPDATGTDDIERAPIHKPYGRDNVLE